MTFPTRWKILGTLTTRSFLHIGSGQAPYRVKMSGVEVQAASIVRNSEEDPMIPGSTMRGRLRAWLRDHGADTSLINEIFGQEAIEGVADTGLGGKAEFWESPLVVAPSGPVGLSTWDATRNTGITVSSVLNRTTKTAQEKLLAHQEAVPEDAKFRVTITGEGLTDEEIGLLLQGLKGFNDPDDPAALGSDTGRGWGRMAWELEEVHIFGKEQLEAWYEKGDDSMWFTMMERLTQKELDTKFTSVALGAGGPAILLNLRISFDRQFLINDPALADIEGSPNHTPVLDKNGNAKLPEKTLQSALRGQAERIVRTLGGYACRPDLGGDKVCRPIYHSEEIERLCPVCQVFGAGGWKAPFELMEIRPVGNSSFEEQEYVAIDRFTGGGVDGAKFDSKASWKPSYKVKAKVDLGRMSLRGVGLLALVLRDLAEGDIPIGLMKRNGFGACRMTVEKIDCLSLEQVPGLDSRLKANGLTGTQDFSISPLQPGVENLLKSLLTDFHDYLPLASAEQGGAV